MKTLKKATNLHILLPEQEALMSRLAMINSSRKDAESCATGIFYEGALRKLVMITIHSKSFIIISNMPLEGVLFNKNYFCMLCQGSGFRDSRFFKYFNSIAWGSQSFYPRPALEKYYSLSNSILVGENLKKENYNQETTTEYLQNTYLPKRLYSLFGSDSLIKSDSRTTSVLTEHMSGVRSLYVSENR